MFYCSSPKKAVVLDFLRRSSTYTNKTLHASSGQQNTFSSKIWPGSAKGCCDGNPKRVSFLILSVCNAPYQPLSAGGYARSRCQTTWIIFGDFSSGFRVTSVQVTGHTFQRNQWYHCKDKTSVSIPSLVVEVVALAFLELGGPESRQNHGKNFCTPITS